MSSPDASQDPARIDARIAELEAELASLRQARARLAPPRTATPRTAASVLLTLAALLLIAAVASFAGFVWPHLTPPARAGALAALTVALAGVAFALRHRTARVAEALAAVAAASAAVLSVWWHIASSVEPTPAGVALALGVAGAAVGAATIAHRFRMWVTGSSLLVTLAALVLALDAPHPDAYAAGFALVLALGARTLVWRPLVWGSALLGTTAALALAERAGHALPASVPLAVVVLAAAWVCSRPPTARPSLHWHARAAGLTAAVCVSLPLVAWAPRSVLADSPDARLDAALLLAAVAVLARCTPRSRRAAAPLAVAAVACVAANTAPLVLTAATLALGALLAAASTIPSRTTGRSRATGTTRRFVSWLGLDTPLAAIVYALVTAASAVVVSPVDSPSWFALAAAAVVPAVVAFAARSSHAALCAAVLAVCAWVALPLPGPFETSTLGAAVLLAGGFALARRATPRLSSWWLAPSLASALVPSALATAPGPGALVRTAAVGLLAALLLTAGARLRLAGLVAPAAVALGIVLVLRLWHLATDVPLWIPLAVVGAGLLWAAARLEASLTALRRTSAWFSNLS